MNFTDHAQAVDGELWVRALHRDGTPLQDPYSIFRDPGAMRELNAHSLLGGFPEASGHIFLGSNLVVDLGRQTLAYLVGGKDSSASVISDNWLVTQGSWGTHDDVPRFSDSALSASGANEIQYAPGLTKKQIFSVDWPQPFVVRFEIVLNSDEGNGYLLREMGLWTKNNTLFARKVFPAIEKNDTFALGFLWRCRF